MAKKRASAIRSSRKRILSQARTRRRFWPAVRRMTLAAPPAAPLRISDRGGHRSELVPEIRTECDRWSFCRTTGRFSLHGNACFA